MAALRVVALKTDYLDCPLGLETRTPMLSWRLESDRRGIRQKQYRVVVSSTRDGAAGESGDLWESGWISSSRSFCITYAGRPLQSRQRCWWRVEVRDSEDNHATSDVAWWEMGLLSHEDWTGHWLAVEDAAARDDRQAGLRWIRGSTVNEEAVSRKFRCKLQLSSAARAGVLFVGSKSELVGVWVDGNPLAIEPRPEDFYGARPLHQFNLPPLIAGSHLIAVEVVAKGGLNESLHLGPGELDCLDAMTALVRFELEGGRTVRVGSGPEWRTSVTRDADWFSLRYESPDWETAAVATGETAQPWPAAPAMHLRKKFRAGSGVVRARLYITALGAYEARVNGSRVGDDLLAPESTCFTKRALYRVHDVTELLRNGGNVLSLTVGDGWFASDLVIAGRYPWLPAPRRVLAQLEVMHADGSLQTIATGPGWRLASSAIVRSEIYDGELYDARLQLAGWDTCEFDDSAWEEAQIGEAPPCRLTAQVTPPIRRTQLLSAQALTNPSPGVWVFDFGQNFAGTCRLQVKGPRGSRVEMKFGEILLPSGQLDRSNLWGAKQTDVFILRGDAVEEVYEPHFSYHGFRYVEVSGFPGTPSLDSLQGLVIHSDLPITGVLASDEPLVQRIWSNTLWTQRSNFVGIPTDCPQRRERLGWFADAGVFWDAAAFNMDVDSFTRRFMQDASDNQNPDGGYSLGAPFPYSSVPYDVALVPAPGWADAPIILTWTAWWRYADSAIIEQNWDSMNRQLQFVLKHNPNGIWRNKRSDFGDWLAVDWDNAETPVTSYELIGTAYWAHSTSLLARMGEAIGRHEEAASLRRLHSLIRQAFVSMFVRDDGRVGNETQTSYVLALKYGLVPDDLRPKAAERLVADVRRRGGALSTGFLGTQYILDVLADSGYAEVALGLLLRTEYPSWGYMIARGGTTIWESWNEKIRSGRKDGIIRNSYNHYRSGCGVRIPVSSCSRNRCGGAGVYEHPHPAGV